MARPLLRKGRCQQKSVETMNHYHALPLNPLEPEVYRGHRSVIGVLDPDPAIRTALERLFSQSGFLVRLYADVRDTMEGVLKNEMSLLVMDAKLARDDGIEFARRIRERSSLPIILLGNAPSTNSYVRGLDAGADDFLAKPIEPVGLMAKVRSILRRVGMSQNPLDRQFHRLRIGDLTLDINDHDLINDAGEREHLTEREFAVLLVMASSPGQAVSRDVLFRDAIGTEWDPRDRRVDLHVAHVRKKVENLLAGRQFIRTERGRGYRVDVAVEPLEGD